MVFPVSTDWTWIKQEPKRQPFKNEVKISHDFPLKYYRLINANDSKKNLRALSIFFCSGMKPKSLRFFNLFDDSCVPIF